MKELSIAYLPSENGNPPHVRVSRTDQPGMQPKTADVDFDFIITDNERRDIQWYLEESLMCPWGEFRNRAERIEKEMQEIGARLFNAIFESGAAAKVYSPVSDELGNTKIVIHASDPTGIAIPWELIRDPELDYGGLAHLAHSFVRSQPNLKNPTVNLPQSDTLNILMVICRPGGPDGDVGFQSVARPLLEIFRDHRDRINLDVLRPPTFEKLSRVLDEKPNYYHVLHFDGHGTFANKGKNYSTSYLGKDGQQGRLLFETDNDGHREVTGSALGELLARAGVPIVLLNACQSGMTHPESAFPSVGNQLLQAGARGVVAMAYSVYVHTAARFMKRLYECFLSGHDLSRSVQMARNDLYASPDRSTARGRLPLQDWMVPILLESAEVNSPAPKKGLEIVLGDIETRQAAVGTELDFPEPPDFGFIGRDNVILELERAYRKNNIVLLEGMAGVGKTETSAAFARWLTETGGLDGPMFFFRFERYLPLSQVCDKVGIAFNQIIKQQIGGDWHLLDAAQRQQVALTVLKQIKCFIIWDNFEPVAGFPSGTPSTWSQEDQNDLRGFLKDLHGGATKVLITSRRNEDWLGKIYNKVELRGLRLHESQELAVKVMEHAGLKPNVIRELPDYNALLKYLAGNPLAIQVIITELSRIKPDALLSTLKSGTANLADDDKREGREHSLAASLSYRLDAPDLTLRKRLGVLALFQGFVDVGVLAIISQEDTSPELIKGLDKNEWIRVLDPAAEIGLLRKLSEGIYTIHPAVPWFLHDLMIEAFPGEESDGLTKAFCKAYRSYGNFLYRLFDSDAQMAVTLLRFEEGNLMCALRLSQEMEMWDEVQHVLYSINRLLTLQGRFVEWEKIVTELETMTQGSDGELLHGCENLWISLLGHRCELAMEHRDTNAAKTIYLCLKEHYEQIGDDRNLAVALHQLGIIAQEHRDFDKAEELYKCSLEVAERFGSEQPQADTFIQLGMLAEECGKLDEAERWFKRGLEITEQTRNEQGHAAILHMLGIIAETREEFSEAQDWCRRSLEIKELIGDKKGQSASLHQMGVIAEKCGELDEAEKWYKRSLEIDEWIGDDYGQATTLHQLGRIAQERRELDEARGWYKRSLVKDERIGNEHGQATTLHQLGRIAQECREFDEAKGWYKRCFEIMSKIWDEQSQATILGQLGLLAEDTGKYGDAVDFLKQAEAIFIKVDDVQNLETTRDNLKRVREKMNGEGKDG